MTTHQRLLDLIAERQGKFCTGSAKLLGRQLGYEEKRMAYTQREVADMVQHLRDHHHEGHLIGITGEGYYWITTQAEADETYARLVGPALARIRRAERFRRRWGIPTPQLELELEGVA